MDRTAYYAARGGGPLGCCRLRRWWIGRGVLVALARRDDPGSGHVSFDVLAPHYRWMELLLAGEKLQRCRTAFLKEVADARDVLIVGEGHGRFLVECRRRLPDARITCVDASERMLEVARARLRRAGA